MNSDWIDDPTTIPVGAEVGVVRGYNSHVSVLTIKRHTKTQATLSDGSRWNNHGREIGVASKWNRSHLITAEYARARIAEAEQAAVTTALRNIVRAQNWREVSEDKVKRIVAILKEDDPK